MPEEPKIIDQIAQKDLIDAAREIANGMDRDDIFHKLIIQDKSYEVIAEETGLNLGTVKSRINRMRKEFRRKIPR